MEVVAEIMELLEQVLLEKVATVVLAAIVAAAVVALEERGAQDFLGLCLLIILGLAQAARVLRHQFLVRL